MSKLVAIDFDGTCVEHCYPLIGPDIGAVPWLQKLDEMGVKIILWTMRSSRVGRIDKKGREETADTLQEAVDWFAANNIKLWGINKNPDQDWSDSPKAYAHLYVDDAALGCPLKQTGPLERPFVDWEIVGPKLIEWAKNE